MSQESDIETTQDGYWGCVGISICAVSKALAETHSDVYGGNSRALRDSLDRLITLLEKEHERQGILYSPCISLSRKEPTV